MSARCAVLLLAVAAACSAEPLAFAGPARQYQYRVDQEVAWESAGDQLVFRSALAWHLALKGAGPGRLDATVLNVIAAHEGPEGRRKVDTREDGSRSDDPLLGHLLAARGRTLAVSYDPATGRVAAVQGGEEIAKAIGRASPNAADPGAPSPLEVQARRLYSSEALARLWTQLLLLPAAGPQAVPLGEPLSGEAQRTWQGSAWTLALPGSGELPITLFKDPTPVGGVLHGLAGKGSLELKDGWPLRASGELAFQLRLSALTQPVEQRHKLVWSFTDITPQSADRSPQTPRP